MAEVKNLFVKSKMNKDLDARLLTNGEYRDAQNISVSKSEGADVGAVENILGNIELIDFETIVTNAVTAKYNALGFTIETDAINYKNLEVIGQASNTQTDSVVVFLTDWTDTSNDKLSNFPGDVMVTNAKGTNVLEYSGPGCFICYYNFQTGLSSVLVAGSYLNFSKSHPILGADYLEDFLYFTDNRNQPRKINVSTALARSYTSNSPYYGTEDDVSVCKYAPYESIGFIDATNNSTLISKTEKFLPSNVAVVLSAPTAFDDDEFDLDKVLNDGTEIAVGGIISIPSTGDQYDITSVSPAATTTNVGIAPAKTTQAYDTGTLVTVSRANPDFDSAFAGDANLLKEEFPRYSYRFRYDDGEYSLMAPFSQIAFIPEQYGYFLVDDENSTGESGIVKFMENMVDQIFLQIPMPAQQSQLASAYKISEIDILAKNAGESTVKVVDTVLINDISYSSTIYSYQYDSTQPFKTLPEKDITRVSDKAPIRAASQAIIGNRIVYGNFLDKHTYPISLDFTAKIEQKEILATSTIRKEYPNHTLKQNRTYQLGLVLMDRYGRSSGVITSENFNAVTVPGNKRSSIYANYSNAGASALNWAGNCLGLVMNEPVPSNMFEEGYPGLYEYKNPLGWYSYKVVVKQTEQEYYNVYVPGAIAGNITWSKKEEVTKTVKTDAAAAIVEVVDAGGLTTGMTLIKNNKSTGIFITNIAGLNVTLSEGVTDLYKAGDEIIFQQITYPTYNSPSINSNIVLFGDNINKVPRDLNKVGPTDRIYASDVRLFNRVNPVHAILPENPQTATKYFYNTQHEFASPLVGDEAISIRPFRDLGEWSLQSSRYYPTTLTAGGGGYIAAAGSQKLQLFYKSENNPFIASLSTNSVIGVNPITSDSTTYTNRNLGVFETEPTTSLLDIFWETSTSGLISDLRTEVDTNNDGPVAFTDVSFNLNESQPKGTLATNYFELIKADGNPTNDASVINMTNLRVVDGASMDRSNEFILEANNTSPNTLFAIKTNAEFYYGSTAGTDENYTITIDCEANGITNTLTIPGPCQLSNVSPLMPTIQYRLKNDDLQPNVFYATDTFANLFPNYTFDPLNSIPSNTYDLGTLEIAQGYVPDLTVAIANVTNGFVDSLDSIATNETVVVFSTTNDGVDNNGKMVYKYDSDFDVAPAVVNKAYLAYTKPTLSQLVGPNNRDFTLNIQVYDITPGGGKGEFLQRNGSSFIGGSSAQPQLQGNNLLNIYFTYRYFIA